MPQPTGDELALLKAVAAHPADDLPRLVYADWLDEHRRHERAEFIRLQIADEQGHGYGRQRAEWQERARELANDFTLAWLRELPRWAGRWYADRPWQRPEFRRGFIEELNVYASPYLRFGGLLLDRLPVTQLMVYHLKGLRRELAGCPWLGRVTTLNLSYEELGEAGAAALAANPHLGGVAELNLAGCGLGDAGVRALAEAGSLGGLKVLDLRSNRLSLSAARALRGAACVRGVGHLRLGDNPQLLREQFRLEDWFGGRVTLEG